MSENIALRARLRLLGPSAAIVVLWLARTLLGLLAVYPVLSAIEASGIGNGPDRDAVLFEPGALMLLEVLRIARPSLVAAADSALLWAALCAVLELVPLGIALDLLNGEERTFRARVLYSVGCFWRFLGLGLLAFAVQALFALGASLLAGLARLALAGRDERLVAAAPAVLFGLALLAAVWVGGVLDVARATVLSSNVTAKRALLRALAILRRRALDVLAGCTSSAAGALLAYLVAAWLLTRVDLTRQAGSRVLLAFVVHQVAILIGIAWRVRWLGHALVLDAAGAPDATELEGSARN